MDIYEAIDSRRTVRDFKAKKVATETLNKILSAGLRAPTNDHLRSWEFIIVDGQTARLELLGLIKKERTEKEAAHIIDAWGLVDPCQREMYIDAIPKQYQMLLQAGSLIIPCFRQKQPLLQPANLSALNGFASIWCCIENILLAAAAEGVYGVTRIPAEEERSHMKSILKVPADYEIPCYLALGYPEANAKQVEQHVMKAEERIHFNRW